jgi:hypothetical protein
MLVARRLYPPFGKIHRLADQRFELVTRRKIVDRFQPAELAHATLRLAGLVDNQAALPEAECRMAGECGHRSEDLPLVHEGGRAPLERFLALRAGCVDGRAQMLEDGSGEIRLALDIGIDPAVGFHRGLRAKRRGSEHETLCPDRQDPGVVSPRRAVFARCASRRG